MEIEKQIIMNVNNYNKFIRKTFQHIIDIIFPGRDIDDHRISKIENNLDLSCKDLMGKTMSISMFDSISKSIANDYVSSLVSDGDPVGVTTAQSESQYVTQTVLKSQHGTGKKSSSSPVSILTLIRLKNSKSSIKIHIKNEQISTVTKLKFLSVHDQYINEHEKKFKEFEKILEDNDEEKYFTIMEYFANDELEELKINPSVNDGKNNKQTKKNFDFNIVRQYLDSLKKNLSQIKQKFREINDDDFDFYELSKNFNYEFKRNFRMWFSSRNFDCIRDFLLREYEEVKVMDLIAPSCGECRYRTSDSKENYDCDENFVYINHDSVEPKSKIFIFDFDVVKLKNSGVKHTDIYEIISRIKNIMFCIHPLHTFRFDLVPRNNPDTVVQNIINNLMNERVKGIPNLETIETNSLEPKDLTNFQYYDEELNETHVFLNSRNLLYFPIEEFKKRITDENGNDIDSKYDNIRPDKLGVFKIVYPGKIRIQPIPYYYFDFIGTMTSEDVKSSIRKYINIKYFLTNSHLDMIKTVGKVGARVLHESSYVDDLLASDNVLNYQHVSLTCRHIFGFELTPITPSGFMKSPGVTIIDKLCFQNHEANISDEIIKGNEYSTDGLTTSIFFGKKPKLGTNYVSFKINDEERKKVNDELALAIQDQKYCGKYPGIIFPTVGEIKPLTKLNDDDPESFFTNNFSGQ